MRIAHTVAYRIVRCDRSRRLDWQFYLFSQKDALGFGDFGLLTRLFLRKPTRKPVFFAAKALLLVSSCENRPASTVLLHREGPCAPFFITAEALSARRAPGRFLTPTGK